MLCPVDFSLGPASRHDGGSLTDIFYGGRELSLYTAVEVEKGSQFLPWRGSVRSEVLPPFLRLPEWDLRHRFGLHDEIREDVSSSSGADGRPRRPVRHCNWVRFLRTSLVMTPEVNLVGMKNANGGPTGVVEPVFEAIRSLEAGTELVAFLVPEPRQELGPVRRLAQELGRRQEPGPERRLAQGLEQSRQEPGPERKLAQEQGLVRRQEPGQERRPAQELGPSRQEQGQEEHRQEQGQERRLEQEQERTLEQGQVRKKELGQERRKELGPGHRKERGQERKKELVQPERRPEPVASRPAEHRKPEPQERHKWP